MMQQLRRSMPLVLWIVVLAFIGTIIFSWGMGGFQDRVKPGIVGIIEGEEITSDYYESIVSQEADMQFQQTGIRPEGDAMTDIRSRAWESIIEEILLQKEIRRRGITVSDSEVVNLLLYNPFNYIIESPYFQTDGEFDIDKYHAYMSDPRSRDQVIVWEQSYRQSLLRQKLISQVISVPEISDAKLLLDYEKRNVTAKADYLLFSAEDFEIDTSTITDEEVEAYYYEHLKNYLVEEKRRILFTRVSYTTSAMDSADIRSTAQEIKRRLDEGSDFANLAVLYSEHTTAPDSGYLGWKKRESLEAAGDSAVWSISAGDYAGPIETKFGISFYKVEDREKRDGELQSEVRMIQLKFEPSAESRDETSNKMMNFADDVKENDFIQTAMSYGLEVDTSSYFRRGVFLPGIGRSKAAVDFTFLNPAGTTSEIYPTVDGLAVIKVLDVEPETYRSLDEVKSEIVDHIVKMKQLEEAYNQSVEFMNNLADVSSWREVAEEDGYIVNSTESEFRFGDYVRNVGRDLAFTSSALRAGVGELFGPVKGEKGAYLIELTEKTPVDTLVFNNSKSSNYLQALQTAQEYAYRQWYADLKEEAKIEDFRYMYYRSY